MESMPWSQKSVEVRVYDLEPSFLMEAIEKLLAEIQNICMPKSWNIPEHLAAISGCTDFDS